jgi:hypothetical protein
MTTLNTDTVLQILRQHGRENIVEPSPLPGHLRINDMSNDVHCAIEKLGGVTNAADKLGTTEEAVNTWIDDYFVPEPFAGLIKEHTGYGIYSLQESTFYVRQDGEYWPHVPTKKELKRPGGIGIYTKNRGREQRSPSPPSEPCVRFSRDTVGIEMWRTQHIRVRWHV